MKEVRTQSLAQRKQRIKQKVLMRKHKIHQAQIQFEKDNKVKRQEPDQSMIFSSKERKQIKQNKQYQRFSIQKVKNRQSARRSRQLTKLRIRSLQAEVKRLKSVMVVCCQNCRRHAFSQSKELAQYNQFYNQGIVNREKPGRKPIHEDRSEENSQRLQHEQNYQTNGQRQINQSKDAYPLAIFANALNNQLNSQEKYVISSTFEQVKCQEQQFQRVKSNNQLKSLIYPKIAFLAVFVTILLLSGPKVSSHYQISRELFLDQKIYQSHKQLFIQDLKRQKFLLCRKYISSERCDMYRKKSVIFIKDYHIVKTNQMSNLILTQWINIIFYVQNIGYVKVKGKVNAIKAISNKMPFTDNDNQPLVPFKQL